MATKKLATLKNITTKPELAKLLEVKPSTLTYVLYILKPDTQYYQFEIPKRNGGKRVINAPTGRLKNLQSRLSILLQDCIDEINEVKYPKPEIKRSTLAHGFVRKRSIITNAMMHLNKKHVLNIDLTDFFDRFNFGRVRGFFIKNKNFELSPDIATVIAQIACYENKLPQGSPCSPVITNLITHSLDIRLASLAKKYSCTYSRYADDITFSTRKSIFPTQIMRQEEGGEYIAGKELRNDITSAGFSINDKKTRIQYKDSRQYVTGLVVNKKPNVKKEYWRTVRSQCHRLFNTGSFTKKMADGEVEGNIEELEGQLNFIDHVDKYNRLRKKKQINNPYKHCLNGREKTFSRFLYYRWFYGNTQPTILCEGKTDNIYLESAINILVDNYPKLATKKTKDNAYKLSIRFMKYSGRTHFLMGLNGGGTGSLKNFLNKFDDKYKSYKAPRPQHPVIIVLDNDCGLSGFRKDLLKISTVTLSSSKPLEKDNDRTTEFIHVVHNLYVVLTPEKDTSIEDLFDNKTRKTEWSGKTFNPDDKEIDTDKEYSKIIFATRVVKAQKGSIDFNGFKPLLDRVVGAINHYDSIKDL